MYHYINLSIQSLALLLMQQPIPVTTQTAEQKIQNFLAKSQKAQEHSQFVTERILIR